MRSLKDTPDWALGTPGEVSALRALVKKLEGRVDALEKLVGRKSVYYVKPNAELARIIKTGNHTGRIEPYTPKPEGPQCG